MKKTKRLISIILALTMLISIFSINIIANANVIARGVCGANLKWSLESNYTLTISGTGKMYNFDTENPSPWHDNDLLTSVVIERGVTSIGSCAFSQCDSLTDISISSTVTNIGSSAFRSCLSLKNITLPDSITELSNATFAYCYSLKNIALPTNLKTIGSFAFRHCESLEKLVLPSKVTTIDMCAFETCKNLEGLYFPVGLEKYGQGIVQYCSNLKYIYYAGTKEQWKNVNGAKQGNSGKIIIYHYDREHDYIPTVFDNGTQKYQCTMCDEYYTLDSVETEHNFTEWIVEKEPDCIYSGKEIRTCKECGAYETRTINRIDHIAKHYEEVAPTCTSAGRTEGTKCSMCHLILSGLDTIPALDHTLELIAEKSAPSTCTVTGKEYYVCKSCGTTVCKDLPLLPHECEVIQRVPSTSDTQGYEVLLCKNCGFSYKTTTSYTTDDSALIAALVKASLYEKGDFSDETYEEFQRICELCDTILNGNATQEEIDVATAELLAAINALVPYVNISIEAENGYVDVEYDHETHYDSEYSVLFGTKVSLTAIPLKDYEFVGWYEKSIRRVLSKEYTYTFYATANMKLVPKFIPIETATLTFANDSGWVADSVTLTLGEWSNMDSIEDLVPEVPYQYGYKNGKWQYNNDDVLTKLQNGEDVIITPAYVSAGYVMPAKPELSNEPAINLEYSFDSENSVGSFIMTSSVPMDCKINSIGIAFYYDLTNKFDPTDMYLTLNNKALTFQFDYDEVNIVDIKNMTSNYSYASVGYITYFDTNNQLKTVYSNQVNVINREQV